MTSRLRNKRGFYSKYLKGIISEYNSSTVFTPLTFDHHPAKNPDENDYLARYN
jgi:hypothetical protein